MIRQALRELDDIEALQDKALTADNLDQYRQHERAADLKYVEIIGLIRPSVES